MASKRVLFERYRYLPIPRHKETLQVDLPRGRPRSRSLRERRFLILGMLGVGVETVVWLSLWERFTRQPPPTQLYLTRLTSLKNPPKVVFEPSLVSIVIPPSISQKKKPPHKMAASLQQVLLATSGS